MRLNSSQYNITYGTLSDYYNAISNSTYKDLYSTQDFFQYYLSGVWAVWTLIYCLLHFVVTVPIIIGILYQQTNAKRACKNWRSNSTCLGSTVCDRVGEELSILKHNYRFSIAKVRLSNYGGTSTYNNIYNLRMVSTAYSNPYSPLTPPIV